MDKKDKNKETIIKFALDELKKTVDSLKQGKSPIVSSDLKKIFNMLNDANTTVEKDKLPEETLDAVLEEAVKKVKETK
jgi:hypothetical protein